MEDHSDQSPLEEREARTNRLWWALGIVGVLAAFGIGFLLARLFQPAIASADILFAQNMTVHHSQAVEMATYLYERTNDAGLKTMAYDIMLSQQGQIGVMQGWLELWNQPAAAPGGTMQMPGMATQEQVNALKTLPSPALEKQFLELMIRHHQGGVAMAQAELQTGSQPNVKRLADNIVKGQQAEIEYMQGLLQKMGAAPLPEATPMPMSHPMPTAMP